MKKGCAHNDERTILYSPSAVDGGGKLVLVPGDTIRFICPHGCPDIKVDVKRTIERDILGRKVVRVMHNENGRKP